MNKRLTGIPETMLIPLWARATETGRDDAIIKDPSAVKMVAAIDYDFSIFESARLSQVGVSIRTMLLDDATREFARHNPGAVVINLGAGLDTRFERLSGEPIGHWYDLDVPEGIALRQKFFAESERNTFIAKSLFDRSWLKDVEVAGKPVLIIAEGLLMYFSEEELRPFFTELCCNLPGAEMLFEMLAPFLVGKSNKHDSLSKMSAPVEFKWGLKNSRDMERWPAGISWIEEWDYLDYYKARWKLFGYVARSPLIRPKLSNRIVHIRFSGSPPDSRTGGENS